MVNEEHSMIDERDELLSILRTRYAEATVVEENLTHLTAVYAEQGIESPVNVESVVGYNAGIRDGINLALDAIEENAYRICSAKDDEDGPVFISGDSLLSTELWTDINT
jgi:hypothetical protein